MASQNVLFVDDEPDAIELFKAYSENENFNVVSAEDGERAMDLISKTKIDLAVLDITLPGMSGFDLLKEIRDGGNELPVIMLTGHASPRAKQRAADLSCSFFIEKPYNKDDLLTKINSLLKG